MINLHKFAKSIQSPAYNLNGTAYFTAESQADLKGTVVSDFF